MIKVAINGFGRIGRNTLKAILSHNIKVEIVAINDLAPVENLAYLLTYDSTYGRYEEKVQGKKSATKKIGSIAPSGELTVGRKKIPTFSERDPAQLPWKALGVDVVLECTGIFRTKELASLHLKAGAKRVIISAPAKGDGIRPYILGVNDHEYEDDTIIDNASCTTNCIAPVVAVLHEKFGVLKSMMTTIHAYTADQGLQDAPHKDFRRGRAAGMNMVPTTTGSAIATTKIIPELEGKFDGISIRVPVVCGSLSDLTLLLAKNASVDEINKTFIKASKSELFHGILGVSDEPLVSSDIIGNPHSAIVDLSFTRVVGGNLVKVLAWYDNEWGYSCRLAEMTYLIGTSIPKK